MVADSSRPRSLTDDFTLTRELKRIAKMEERAGQPMFMGKPDRWYDKPHWRCQQGHVSLIYLKRDPGGAVCLACYETVYLTFPEDSDGELESRPRIRPLTGQESRHKTRV